MPRKRLLEEFSSFMRSCSSDQVSLQQRRDLRMAFMAGAATLHRVMVTNLVSENFITPSDIQMVRDIQEELVAYNKDVAEGRA